MAGLHWAKSQSQAQNSCVAHTLVRIEKNNGSGLPKKGEFDDVLGRTTSSFFYPVPVLEGKNSNRPPANIAKIIFFIKSSLRLSIQNAKELNRTKLKIIFPKFKQNHRTFGLVPDFTD